VTGDARSSLAGDDGSGESTNLGEFVALRELAFEAEDLVRDSSGSFWNTHSRPLDVHLAQGYSRLHLIFDSAHA
jgi:hypothetical protein